METVARHNLYRLSNCLLQFNQGVTHMSTQPCKTCGKFAYVERDYQDLLLNDLRCGMCSGDQVYFFYTPNEPTHKQLPGLCCTDKDHVTEWLRLAEQTLIGFEFDGTPLEQCVACGRWKWDASIVLDRGVCWACSNGC